MTDSDDQFDDLPPLDDGDSIGGDPAEQPLDESTPSADEPASADDILDFFVDEDDTVPATSEPTIELFKSSDDPLDTQIPPSTPEHATQDDSVPSGDESELQASDKDWSFQDLEEESNTISFDETSVSSEGASSSEVSKIIGALDEASSEAEELETVPFGTQSSDFNLESADDADGGTADGGDDEFTFDLSGDSSEDSLELSGDADFPSGTVPLEPDESGVGETLGETEPILEQPWASGLEPAEEEPSEADGDPADTVRWNSGFEADSDEGTDDELGDLAAGDFPSGDLAADELDADDLATGETEAEPELEIHFEGFGDEEIGDDDDSVPDLSVASGDADEFDLDLGISPQAESEVDEAETDLAPVDALAESAPTAASREDEFDFKLEEAVAIPEEARLAAAETPEAVKLDSLPSQNAGAMPIAPAVAVKTNPLWWFVRFLVGGLGTLLLLLLLQVGAWWAGFDWLGLAPTLPQSVAWLAPASLRPDLTKPIRPSSPRPESFPESDTAGSDTRTEEPVSDPVVEPEGSATDEAEDLSPPLDELETPDTAANDALAAAVEGSGTSDIDLVETERALDLETPSPTDADTDVLPSEDVTSALEASSPAADDLDSGSGTRSEGLPTEDEMGTGDRLPAEDPLEDSFASSERATESSVQPPVAIEEPRPEPEPVVSPPEPVVTQPVPEVSKKLVGPVPAKWFTVREVSDTYKAAMRADRALDNAQLAGEKREQQSAARDFYVALAKFGEALTYVEPTAAERVQQKSRELLGRFEFDESKLRLIGRAGSVWFDRDLGAGAVVAGTVTNIDEGADVVTLTMELLGKNPKLIEVVAKPGRVATGIGERLLVAGTIVKNPLQNLSGYAGDKDRVLWLGVTYQLP